MIKSFQRVLRTGWVSFWRNRWLSLTSVMIMVLTMLSISSLLFVNVMSSEILTDLQDKIDISVYFVQQTDETDVNKVKEDLLALEQVKSVAYVSREEALEKFSQKHVDNEVLIESLEELGDNPLLASLNIKANTAASFEASIFESIANYLEQDKYKSLIEKVNYRQNKEAIVKLASISRVVKRSGLMVTIFLVVIAGLVAFNTVRLTVYSWRDEITVMRLVGATNWFIRGPFLVEGVLYGAFAALLTAGILALLLYAFSAKIQLFLSVDLWGYYQSNFVQILVFQMIVGLVLGGLSSFVAIRRYLKA